MAHNEEANIARLLDSVLAQTASDRIARVVVVASGCTDRTCEIVETYCRKDARITLVAEAERAGKVRAINAFMTSSPEPILAVSGADMIYTPQTIAAMLAPFDSPDVGMVGSHPVPLNDTKTFVGFAVDLLWKLHHEISQYLEQVDPDLMGRVQMYQDSQPLFEKFDIEREIRDLFKARCDLPNGGSIVIQPTEALVSIDVNTGRYTGKKDPEKTILRTNLEAAREIARQIRLRDIGGIIVCDFIDMETRSNKDRVLQELRQHLVRDRARTKAHAVSELGLVEMTRQRVRPSLWHSMTADCPTCTGTGRVFRPEVVARRLERSLKRVGYEHRERQLAIRLHPEVALYLLEEEPKLVQGLGRQTGVEFEVRDDPMMRLDEFRLMSRPAGRDVTEQYAVA